MAVSKDERFWKRVAIALMIFAGVVSAFVITNEYNAVAIAHKPAAALSGKYLVLSTKSKDELIAFMNKEKSIVAISTIAISLVTNKKHSTFFEAKDPEVESLWLDYMARRNTNPLVFTSAENHNSRITSIINGNFECRKTTDTIVSQLFAIEKFAPFVCSISVPAGFDESGDFVGYINFFLKEELNDYDKARITKDAIILSTTIYKRDIFSRK